MSELKECPFCGGEAQVIDSWVQDPLGRPRVDCTVCRGGFDGLPRDHLIDMWNTRANSDLEARLVDSVVIPEFAVKLTNGREFELSEADVKKALITLACHKFGIVGWPELVVRKALSEGK